MKTMKYFSATWCGPCKAFKPVMNEIAGEGYSIYTHAGGDYSKKYNNSL